ncbi:hypothetical protein lerEdw1_008221 [Lerista edwardsae]|nr:hypothetical protein lerEdw1_008221 [Lerista edwardsae]
MSARSLGRAVTSAFIHTSRGWIELISAGARLPEPVFMLAESIRAEGSASDHEQKSLHLACSVTPGILHQQQRGGHRCFWNRLPALVFSQIVREPGHATEPLDHSCFAKRVRVCRTERKIRDRAVQSRSSSPLRPAIEAESLGEAARDAGDEVPQL